jgi:hypothetical protein
MICPFREEIIMDYCRAYPVRKLVPRHRISSESLCVKEEHENCPFFKEVMARWQSCGQQEDGGENIRRKEGRQIP